MVKVQGSLHQVLNSRAKSDEMMHSNCYAWSPESDINAYSDHTIRYLTSGKKPKDCVRVGVGGDD